MSLKFLWLKHYRWAVWICPRK